MTSQVFDVQTALLHSNLPNVDFTHVTEQLNARMTDLGHDGWFSVLPGATSSSVLTLAGHGTHVTISLRGKPLERDAFTLALKAPILRTKAFDFEQAIAKHRAGIVINVGDGEVPMPVEARQMMMELGVGAPSDKHLKIKILHAALQIVAALHPPLMVDFCPSQSLLSPDELACVKDMALPVPILFHPYPFQKADPSATDPLRCINAIHAPFLIGAELELEAVPKSMHVADMINLLATLIIKKRAGEMPLNHGDVMRAEGHSYHVRHEQADTGATRIIVSFDTPATARGDEAPVGQQAFQDRIARLKSRSGAHGEFGGPHDTLENATQPQAPTLGGESSEDLRDRIRDTMGVSSEPVVARTSFIPMKLVALIGILAVVYFVAGDFDGTKGILTDAQISQSLLRQMQAADVSDAAASHGPSSLTGARHITVDP